MMSDDDHPSPLSRGSDCSHLQNSQACTDAGSISSQKEDNMDQIQLGLQSTLALPGRNENSQDGTSTSCDANSSLFDETSLASKDQTVTCGLLKKPKKIRSKEEIKLRKDFGMWKASNAEVMKNLLSKSGTAKEQMKWEAIATSRGLCTLTDSCACRDCRRTRHLAGLSDGDGGMGASLIAAVII